VSTDPTTPLRPLHPDSALIPLKLDRYGKLTDEELVDSLRPGREGSLKVRPDGTLIDGHHRVKILRDRGYNVDALPREIVPKETLPEPPD
jgi:hypothetical protein